MAAKKPKPTETLAPKEPSRLLKIVNLVQDNLQVCSWSKPSFLIKGGATVEISEEAAVHYADDLGQFEKQGVIRIEEPMALTPPETPTE